jgi:hypothetical protein
MYFWWIFYVLLVFSCFFQFKNSSKNYFLKLRYREGQEAPLELSHWLMSRWRGSGWGTSSTLANSPRASALGLGQRNENLFECIRGTRILQFEELEFLSKGGNPNREEERRLWIFDFGFSMGRRPRNPSKTNREEARRLWIFDFGFLGGAHFWLGIEERNFCSKIDF